MLRCVYHGIDAAIAEEHQTSKAQETAVVNEQCYPKRSYAYKEGAHGHEEILGDLELLPADPIPAGDLRDGSAVRCSEAGVTGTGKARISGVTIVTHLGLSLKVATDVDEDDDVASDDDDERNGEKCDIYDYLDCLVLRVNARVGTGVALLIIAQLSYATKGWHDYDYGDNPDDDDIDGKVTPGVQTTVQRHRPLDAYQPVQSDGSEVVYAGI